jgi:hypothetical protein
MYITIEDNPEVEQPQTGTFAEGYAEGWADAMSASLRAQNEDLKEIIRIGNERMAQQ